MGGRKTAIEKNKQQAQWVDRLSRFEKDGRTVAAFCAAEGVSGWSFYTWRKRLAAGPERSKPTGVTAAAAAGSFIDAGVAHMSATGPRGLFPQAASSGDVELQIDLGGGVLLRVVRR